MEPDWSGTVRCKTESLSKNIMEDITDDYMADITNKAEILRHQEEFTSLESRTFVEWRLNACRELKSFMEVDAALIVLDYCKPAVADVHYVTLKGKAKKESEPLSSCDVVKILTDVLVEENAQFGDIVEVRLNPETPHGYHELVYFVDDLKGESLIMAEQTIFDNVIIPVKITNNLCNPIEFYRICAPAQGYKWLKFVAIPFTHPYTQRLLRINAASRRDDDYSLYEKLTCYFPNLSFEAFAKYSRMESMGRFMPSSFSEAPAYFYVAYDYGDLNLQINLPATYQEFKLQMANHENSRREEAKAAKCCVCGQKGNLIRCCEKAYYCSVEHRKKDLDLHRKKCKGKADDEEVATVKEQIFELMRQFQMQHGMQ